MIEHSRRDELLAKAAHLFCKKGYHATTMKDIAAELDILPGSLYHHINSKQSLLLEIMQRGIQALLVQVRAIVTSDRSPTEKLEAIVRIHIDEITKQPDVLTVFLHETKSIPPEHMAEQMKLRDEYNHLLKSIIEEGMATGEFRPLHAGAISMAILGMVNWLYTWYRATGSLSAEQIAQEYLSFIQMGLIPHREETACRT